MPELRAICADITTLAVDAIVNSANTRLIVGGGVDGAIHAAAGDELEQACREFGGCPTGEARITRGYNLPAKFVIHTVGPVYGREGGREAELLKSCYTNSLRLAVANKLKSIAFSNISTGVFGYPLESAAQIAVETVKDFILREQLDFEIVYFVSFSDEDREVYERVLGQKG